jgi:hypothetical protein
LPDPKGKVSASPDPKGVGLGSTNPRTTLFTLPKPKGTGLALSDPMKGVSASPNGIYANKPSSKRHAHVRRVVPIPTTLDVIHMPRHDPEQ